MTLTDKTIQATEFAYQHQFDDAERQMIREIAERIARETWQTFTTQCRYNEQYFEKWFNKELEETK